MPRHHTSPPAPPASPGPAPRPQPADATAATSRQALVVDASPLVRSFLRRGLAGHGFAVTEAEDVPQAWRALHDAGPFALVVVEQELRGLAGMELLRRLRADLTFRRVRVVMMTDAADAARAAGADACLAKPFGVPHLQSLLECLGFLPG